MPTRLGQYLEIRPGDDNYLQWTSLNTQYLCWFEGLFDLADLNYCFGTNNEVGLKLQQILQVARKMNPSFLITGQGLRIKTRLEFSQEWGLGSSSTLLDMVARWAEVDPFLLLNKTFGGSGYDIACARAAGPIRYKLENGKPLWVSSKFNPSFADHLYFVYLGRKQDSQEGIQMYRHKKEGQEKMIAQISALTQAMEGTDNLKKFDLLIEEHEKIISNSLGLIKAKTRYFPDYWGKMKSLGAWGGDFILATSELPKNQTINYFVSKGFTQIFQYKELIL